MEIGTFAMLDFTQMPRAYQLKRMQMEGVKTTIL
jgi:hypothetical protein